MGLLFYATTLRTAHSYFDRAAHERRRHVAAARLVIHSLIGGWQWVAGWFSVDESERVCERIEEQTLNSMANGSGNGAQEAFVMRDVCIHT